MFYAEVLERRRLLCYCTVGWEEKKTSFGSSETQDPSGAQLSARGTRRYDAFASSRLRRPECAPFLFVTAHRLRWVF